MSCASLVFGLGAPRNGLVRPQGARPGFERDQDRRHGGRRGQEGTGGARFLARARRNVSKPRPPPPSSQRSPSFPERRAFSLKAITVPQPAGRVRAPAVATRRRVRGGERQHRGRAACAKRGEEGGSENHSSRHISVSRPRPVLRRARPCGGRRAASRPYLSLGTVTFAPALRSKSGERRVGEGEGEGGRWFFCARARARVFVVVVVVVGQLQRGAGLLKVQKVWTRGAKVGR